MEIDFDAQDAISDFISVPAGTYLCRIAEVRTGSTRAGDERWSIRLVVSEGMHVGKQASWDSLVFSVRGRTRARLMLQAFGLRSKGKVQLQPADLEGCTALVEVRPSEYQAPSGQIVRRNEVPYDGYRSAVDGADSSRGATGNGATGNGATEDGASGNEATDQEPDRQIADSREIPF